MTGTTKRCLRKMLGQSQATDEELATNLISIEAALNSRPITQDTEDALTPAHFLCGAKLTALPSTTEPQREGNLKTPEDQENGRRLLETLGEGISHGAKILPCNLNQRGGQGRSKQETSSSSKRITAPDTCERPGWKN